MRLHALVSDLETAGAAVIGGATVVQLRLKGLSTDQMCELGRPIAAACREAAVTFIVNDDVEAAIVLGADGVHLGRGDEGVERAVEAGLLLGRSAASVAEALEAERRGAAYLGAGPVWETPSKPDAGAPIGLVGLGAICSAARVPVIAIGGIDAGNAADCLGAGAAGVAVVRAASSARELRRAIDRAVV